MDEEFHWLISIRRNKLDLWKRQKRFMDAKKLVGNQHEDSFQTWSGSVGRLAINDPRASAETQAAQRRKKNFVVVGKAKPRVQTTFTCKIPPDVQWSEKRMNSTDEVFQVWTVLVVSQIGHCAKGSKSRIM